MNSPFTSGQFYSGLLPADIAAAQAAYGVASGYVAPPSNKFHAQYSSIEPA